MKRNFLRTVTFAAVLAVVSLAGRDFTDTNLSRCRLENSDLSNNRFIRTNLDSTVSGRSKFDGAIMMNCRFNNGMLAESWMYRAQADHRSFSDATIFATDFEGSNFQQCTFYNTNIIASRFKGLRSVRGITFKSGSQNRGRGEGIEYSTAHFNWKATLKDNEPAKTTIFPSLNAYYMEFVPQDNTTFSDAILEHADFSRTCLQELDFTRAQLKGAVFAGANIDRTNLDQSDLECATFCCSFLKNARNLDKVKNAQRMDIGNSAITNAQASTLQSNGKSGI